MRVKLAYGRTGLEVPLPDSRTTVIEPPHLPEVEDPAGTLREAMREPVHGPPLRDLLRPGQTVAITMCDGTRPQPRHLMIPAVLSELAGTVSPCDVTIVVATGTHRGNTRAELAQMLGEELASSVRVVNHDARDPEQLVWMGQHGQAVPVWLNRHWVEADLRITTGYVEPHMFAGFTGGPKTVVPGLTGLDTALTLYSAERIADPQAAWGVCKGNPVYDDIRAVAAAVGNVDFSLDVLLNRDHQIVAAFGGSLFHAHSEARHAARELAMRPVRGEFDIVLTSNGGYPMDQNLYQCNKGLSAAAAIVKPGGTIICAAECRDGFPDHGDYRRILMSAPSPQELLADIESRRSAIADQWQAQVLAKVLIKARVIMRTDHLGAAELSKAHLESTDHLADTIETLLAEYGPDARICVLPTGPQTIPYVVGRRRSSVR